MDKKDDLSWVDLSMVTAEEAKQQYVDYSLFVNNVGFNNILLKHNGKYIKENKTYTVPINIAKSNICKKYYLLDWQFQIKKACNNIDIAIVTPAKKFNEQYIVEDMKQLGYFVSTQEETKLYGYVYVIYRFEPIHQLSVKNEILSMGIILHISPKYLQESIMKNGFIPQHKNNVYKFPDRVYFVKGDVNMKDVQELGTLLYNADKITNKQNIGDYIIYWINTELIPNNVDFFYDPNYENGIYTYDIIPYNCVISTHDICVNPVRNKFKFLK